MLLSFIIKSFTMQQLFLIICPVCSSVWKKLMEQLLLRWFSWNEKNPWILKSTFAKVLMYVFQQMRQRREKADYNFWVEEKKVNATFQKDVLGDFWFQGTKKLFQMGFFKIVSSFLSLSKVSSHFRNHLLKTPVWPIFCDKIVLGTWTILCAVSVKINVI